MYKCFNIIQVITFLPDVRRFWLFRYDCFIALIKNYLALFIFAGLPKVACQPDLSPSLSLEIPGLEYKTKFLLLEDVTKDQKKTLSVINLG